MGSWLIILARLEWTSCRLCTPIPIRNVSLVQSFAVAISTLQKKFFVVLIFTPSPHQDPTPRSIVSVSVQYSCYVACMTSHFLCPFKFLPFLFTQSIHKKKRKLHPAAIDEDTINYVKIGEVGIDISVQ